MLGRLWIRRAYTPSHPPSRMLDVLAVALWALLPAYVPNNAASLFGGGRPIDGGRHWGDRRLLGDGKTWRGLAAGVLAGTALALLADATSPAVAGVVLGDPAALPGFPLRVGVGLAAGAMGGDIAASFVKRRLDRERGRATPGLDQLDFVVGALAVTAAIAPGWVGTWLTPPVLAVALVVTPLLHVGVNAAGYAVGLTKEPY